MRVEVQCMMGVCSKCELMYLQVVDTERSDYRLVSPERR